MNQCLTFIYSSPFDKMQMCFIHCSIPHFCITCELFVLINAYISFLFLSLSDDKMQTHSIHYLRLAHFCITCELFVLINAYTSFQLLSLSDDKMQTHSIHYLRLAHSLPIYLCYALNPNCLANDSTFPAVDAVCCCPGHCCCRGMLFVRKALSRCLSHI